MARAVQPPRPFDPVVEGDPAEHLAEAHKARSEAETALATVSAQLEAAKKILADIEQEAAAADAETQAADRDATEKLLDAIKSRRQAAVPPPANRCEQLRRRRAVAQAAVARLEADEAAVHERLADAEVAVKGLPSDGGAAVD
jgi:hypothetical protein